MQVDQIVEASPLPPLATPVPYRWPNRTDPFLHRRVHVGIEVREQRVGLP